MTGTPEDNFAIRVRDLHKLYRRTSSGHKFRTLKSALLERSLVSGIDPSDAIPALKGVDFDVARGQSLGLIGSNGSGKSTLLKILAGILRPSRGAVGSRGRMAALIELGAGFHPEISGRENIYINGAVLGLSRRQIDARYDDIVAFSGLESFIDEPVKNYSSGMYVRLGFAVAIHTEPEILLVDEVLSVGDEAFAHKCLRRIEAFLARGKTLVLVSHSLPLIESVCDRVLWLEKGVLRADGHPRRVVDAYRQAVAEEEGRIHRETKEARQEAPEAPAEPEAAPPPIASPDGEADAALDQAAGEDEPETEVLRWGSGDAVIESVRILVDGAEQYHFESGSAVTFEITAQAQRPLDDFVFGIAVSTPRGVECWGTNTDLDGYRPQALATGSAVVHVACPMLRLGPGEYLVDIAIHARDGTPYDYRRKLLAFTVTAREGGVGVYFPEHQWTFSDAVRWRESS